MVLCNINNYNYVHLFYLQLCCSATWCMTRLRRNTQSCCARTQLILNMKSKLLQHMLLQKVIHGELIKLTFSLHYVSVHLQFSLQLLELDTVVFRSSSSFIIFHRLEQFAIAKRGWTAREYVTHSLLFVGYEYDPVGTQRTYNAEISFIK